VSEKVNSQKIKECTWCGVSFVTYHGCRELCRDCADFRKSYRNSVAVPTKSSASGNMAEIERVNREAVEQGLSYGKLVAHQFLEGIARSRKR
jgi:hypothetical protein